MTNYAGELGKIISNAIDETKKALTDKGYHVESCAHGIYGSFASIELEGKFNDDITKGFSNLTAKYYVGENSTIVHCNLAYIDELVSWSHEIDQFKSEE